MGQEKDNVDRIDTTKVIIATKVIQQKVNDGLGITKDYNKSNRDKLWDSTKGKREYKEKVFDGKKTYFDPISKKTLHKNQKAAQKKYHMKNKAGENISKEWASHSAETDHINALKDLHDIYKYDAFLNDADFKEIANCDSNYSILSKKINTSKGEDSNWKVIWESIWDKDSDISNSGKLELAKQKIKADLVVNSKFAVRTAENMGKEFAIGAKDTLINSAIPLTAEAIRKMCKVASGDENFEDAVKDMGKILVDTSVVGGGNKLLLDVVNNSLKNSNSAIFSKLANSSAVSQIVAVAIIVNESAVKYINGEINEKQFVEEVGEKGVTMVAGMIAGSIGKEIGKIIGAVAGTIILPVGIGTAVGSVIGEILGAVITTVVCSTLVTFYNTAKHFDDYKLKEKEFKLLVENANKEIKHQREIFRNIVEREYKYWDEEFEKGFELILKNVNDPESIANGLDKILNVFGKNVAFKSVAEYEAQLEQPLVLSFNKI